MSNVVAPLSSSFVIPGSTKPTSTTTRQRSHSLSVANDWQILIDFDHKRIVFPPEICSTDQRPDIVIWSTNSKTALAIELTCPAEENIEAAQAYKESRYVDLSVLARKNKWKVKVITIEAGARGFVARSMNSCFRDLGFTPKAASSLCKSVSSLSSF